MMTQTVGIDVAKNWLDVAIGERVKRIDNTRAPLRALAEELVTQGVMVVGMEPTGGYERLAVAILRSAGLDPCALRNLGRSGTLHLGPDSHTGRTSTERDLMTSFRAFWPLYLQAHRHRGTRIGHYAATVIALSTIAASIALQAPWLTMLGIVLGYAIALAAHRLVDGSKSLVTVNPVWGAVADFKMCWLALTGGLSAELACHVGPTIENQDSRSSREYRTTRRDRWISAARRCC